MLLEENGYKVLHAIDGLGGISLFAALRVDAVILDYQMPGINGSVIAAEMKRLKPNVPILLLSAYGPLPERKLKFVDRFLSKSQPPAILLSTLKELLESRAKPFFYRWLDHWKSRNQVVTR
jgi:CheY-like chemotaxis protein